MALKDGIWLHLPEAPYFAEHRLGSSDITKLFLQKEGYWWSSRMNPGYVDPPRGALTYGRGLHAALLEGIPAYEQRFATMPDKDTLAAQHKDKFCVTVKDIMEALEKRDFNPKGNQGKDWLIEYASTRAADLVIWDKVVADWKKTAGGRQGLSVAEDREIRIMADVVHNHPEMAELFKFSDSHIPLPEISILYHDEHGIPRRNRIDLMLPSVNINLKSLGNVGGKKLAFAAGEHLAQRAYHVGLADENVARIMAYRFITQGKIFDGTPDDERTEESDAQFKREVTWLNRFPKEAPNWSNCLAFFQKPDSKAGHAPIFFPWWEDRGSELHLRGVRCRLEAIQTYRTCMALFGPDKPWTRVEPVHTAEEGAKMRVFVPHWVGGDDHVAGEEEYT